MEIIRWIIILIETVLAFFGVEFIIHVFLLGTSGKYAKQIVDWIRKNNKEFVLIEYKTGVEALKNLANMISHDGTPSQN